MPSMIVGPIDTPIGPTEGGTNDMPFGAADAHPSGGRPVPVVAALAPATVAPMANTLPATTVARVLRFNMVEFPFFRTVVRRQAAAPTSPADTMALPMVAGPITVGPMTVATWPTLGPMKERPLP